MRTRRDEVVVDQPISPSSSSVEAESSASSSSLQQQTDEEDNAADKPSPPAPKKKANNKLRIKIQKPRRRSGVSIPMLFEMFMPRRDAGDDDEGGEGDDDDDDDEEEEDDGICEYDEEEQQYYDGIDATKRLEIDAKESLIQTLDKEMREVPLRFRILNSGMPMANVQAVLHRVASSSDRDKATQYVHNLLRIPFGKYCELGVGPTDSAADVSAFLKAARATMDQKVYGMESVKTLFMTTLAKWATHPSARGLVIGLKGPTGVGKTTLVKDGLGKALGMPSSFIALGSANDSSYLDGHSFTYEGSVCGQIAESLMTCGVMNPILCFDELDKVAENSRGAEIYNTLIHLTDQTQNMNYCDKYFGGNVQLDLSRCILVFTYNESTFINPILKNRMIEICIPDYAADEKRHILQEFVVPRALEEFGPAFDLKKEDFKEDALRCVCVLFFIKTIFTVVHQRCVFFCAVSSSSGPCRRRACATCSTTCPRCSAR